MLPITTLPAVVRMNNINGPGSMYYKRIATKQAKPYDLPAPYTLKHVLLERAVLLGKQTSFVTCDASAEKDPLWGLSPDMTLQYLAQERAWADNSAYDKLRGYLGEESLWFVNWAEREQAVDSITKRSSQLLKALRAVRRGRFGDFFEALELRAPDRRGYTAAQARWRNAKHWSDNWLEYHFGWDPLVQDIYNAARTLSEPVPYFTVYARGRKIKFNGKTGKSSQQTAVYNGHVRTTCGCTMYVSNPNAYLAGRLGFVNPVSIAWELVPFSFLVDWFVNVSDFLNQFTDLWGITTLRPWQSQVVVVESCNAVYKYTYAGNLYGQDTTWRGVWMTRQTSLPSVTLGVRPPKRLSVVRAATAVSLLIQQGFRRMP